MTDILSEVKRPFTPDRIKEIRDVVASISHGIHIVASFDWAERCGQFAGELLHALARIEELEAERRYKPISEAVGFGPYLLWWKTCKEPAVGRFESDGSREGWRCDGDQVIPINQNDCLYFATLPSPPEGSADRAQERGANDKA